MRSRISIGECVRPSVGPSIRPSVLPSVHCSVGHTRVEFLRNGPNSNKIASGIKKYAILKTIQRQVRRQYARTHLLSELSSTCYTASRFRAAALPLLYFRFYACVCNWCCSYPTHQIGSALLLPKPCSEYLFI